MRKKGYESVDIIYRKGKTRGTKVRTIDYAKPREFMKELQREGHLAASMSEEQNLASTP